MSTKTKTLLERAPKLTRAFYAQRRKEFFSRLPDDSIAIIVSNPEQTRSNDTEFPFRQSSDVLYLCGFPEPETVLVFKKSKGRTRFIMFVRPKDAKNETWTGRRIGVEGAKRFGAQETHDINEFEKVLADLIEDADQVFYKLERNRDFDKKFRGVWLSNRQKTLNNPEDLLHDMRRVKSAEELAMMRHAAEITALAHRRAMETVLPATREFHVQSAFETVCAEHGARAFAYNTIAAGGNNAVILHYTPNSEVLADGQLLLLDAGCEFDGYAADITRTFPVGGKFTDAQREVYEVVLKAQLAAIKACKPGTTMERVHSVAENVLRRGLVKLGILPAKMASKAKHDKIVLRAEKGKTDDKIAHLGRFYMHGTSHLLGLDVHDVSGMGKKESKAAPLSTGMVITVEPGIYLDKADKLVPRRYRGIGIRIEDDVVITRRGCEVITSGVPKTVDEIEALMAQAQAKR